MPSRATFARLIKSGCSPFCAKTSIVALAIALRSSGVASVKNSVRLAIAVRSSGCALIKSEIPPQANPRANGPIAVNALRYIAGPTDCTPNSVIPFTISCTIGDSGFSARNAMSACCTASGIRKSAKPTSASTPSRMLSLPPIG